MRTNYRHETVYLYHINASPEAARRLLLVYLARINERLIGPSSITC